MATPSKKRKLNSDSKSSPGGGRSLDYFFGKQRQYLTSRPSKDDEHSLEASSEASGLTDEALARRLQAQWDQEEAAARQAPNSSTLTQLDHLAHCSDPALLTVTTGLEGVDKDNVTNLAKALRVVKSEDPPSEAKGKNTLSLQSAGSAEDIMSSNIPFDESPLTFDPSKYVAELQCHWAAEGGDASYALLTGCFVLVNSTRSRIKIVDTLVNLLRVIIEGDPTSLLPTVRTNIYLSQPCVSFPAYQTENNKMCAEFNPTYIWIISATV